VTRTGRAAREAAVNMIHIVLTFEDPTHTVLEVLSLSIMVERAESSSSVVHYRYRYIIFK
jgi:hypothetical protein